MKQVNIDSDEMQAGLIALFNCLGYGDDAESLYDEVCMALGLDDTKPGEDLDISATTFEERGLMTTDAGVVVTVGKREFQLTIVQSK